LSYLADTQTDRQTKSGKNITTLAEVIMRSFYCTAMRVGNRMCQA